MFLLNAVTDLSDPHSFSALRTVIGAEGRKASRRSAVGSRQRPARVAEIQRAEWQKAERGSYLAGLLIWPIRTNPALGKLCLTTPALPALAHAAYRIPSLKKRGAASISGTRSKRNMRSRGAHVALKILFSVCYGPG